jgi:hypothetical protein
LTQSNFDFSYSKRINSISFLSRPFPLPDSPEALSYKYAIYQHEISPVRQWYTDEHKNWMNINGKNNKWIIWDKVSQETLNVTKKIQNYLERKSLNKAASIADLCILPQELLLRLGEYEQYCPVSLTLRDELVDCSADTRTDYVAEYRGKSIFLNALLALRWLNVCRTILSYGWTKRTRTIFGRS